MSLSQKEVESIVELFNYNPKHCNNMNRGKISFFISLLEETEKQGGIIRYSISSEGCDNSNKLHNKIPNPKNEKMVKCVKKVGYGYFYNKRYNNINSMTDISVKFSEPDKIKNILNGKEKSKTRDSIEGYLFGYPDDAIKQYCQTENIVKKYESLLEDLRTEDNIEDLAYLAAFVYYVPVLKKDKILKASEKGKRRYENMVSECDEYSLEGVKESIQKEFARNKSWIENLGCE